MALFQALLAVALPGSDMAQAGPLHLVTQPEGSGVRISVVGHHVRTCDVSFVLEVVQKSAAGAAAPSNVARPGSAGLSQTFATLPLAMSVRKNGLRA